MLYIFMSQFLCVSKGTRKFFLTCVFKVFETRTNIFSQLVTYMSTVTLMSLHVYIITLVKGDNYKELRIGYISGARCCFDFSVIIFFLLLSKALM